MTDAVIVDVVRTAGGKRNGSLSGWHPADLAGELMATLVERNDLDPATIDDVMMGCVSQVGAQSLNIGRNAALAAGFPDTVPATTIDRQCGSSQQAAAFAAQSIMAGVNDIVIAAGVEVMSLVPMGASFSKGVGFPFGPKVEARYADAGGLIPQGLSAELIAEQWNISREELDAYSAESQMRAARARDEGRFEHEIVPVAVRRRDKESGEVIAEDGGELRDDEGIRDTTTAESLAGLKPAFTPEGRVTAGNSSQITDGASGTKLLGTLLCELERTGGRYGLQTMCEGGGLANATIIERLG